MSKLILALVAAAGCARGSMQTVTLGPSFGDQSGVVIALEGSLVFHEPFASSGHEPGAMPRQRGRVPRYLGAQLTAAAGSLWQPSAGFSGFGAVGFDYLPFLYESGMMVGFGGQVAFAFGAREGLFAVAPRLWFAAPIARLAGAPLLIGLMLRGQIGLETASGAGPSLVISRAAL